MEESGFEVKREGKIRFNCHQPVMSYHYCILEDKKVFCETRYSSEMIVCKMGYDDERLSELMWVGKSNEE